MRHTIWHTDWKNRSRLIVWDSHLSTVLLATLLLPILKDRSPPKTPGRLSIVSSGTGLFTRFSNSQQTPLLKSFDDLETSHPPGLDNYGATKVLGLMFVYNGRSCFRGRRDYQSCRSRHDQGNMIKPRDLPKAVAAMAKPLVFGITRSVRDGASSYLDATITKGKESHGSFIMDWEIRPWVETGLFDICVQLWHIISGPPSDVHGKWKCYNWKAVARNLGWICFWYARFTGVYEEIGRLLCSADSIWLRGYLEQI